MKERISVTIDREIVDLLNSLSKKRKFRNRSHIVEFAVEKLAEEELEGEREGESNKEKSRQGENKEKQRGR